MKVGRRILDFYIDGSIHVGLSVCCLVGITRLELGLPFSLHFMGFALLGTITGYNFVKYAELAGFKHKSLTQSLKSIQVFSVLVFIGFIYFGLKIPLKTLLITGGFGLCTILYVVPFLSDKNFRTISSLKIFIVALVWAGLTSIIPYSMENLGYNDDVVLIFIQRFLLVLVLILPFEIRDMEVDASGLKTLPQRIGISKTKLLGILLLVLIFLLDHFKDELTRNYLLSSVFCYLILGFSLYKAQKKQSKYFSSLWVESIPIVWFISFYLLDKFI